MKKIDYKQLKWSPNAKWIVKEKIDRVDMDIFYGKSMMAEINKVQGELNWAMNEALFGDKKYKDKRTWLRKQLDNLKSNISNIRVRVAEIIGGDDLYNDFY